MGYSNDYEYSELNVDSYNNSGQGGATFVNSSSPTNQIFASWPKYVLSLATMRTPDVVAIKVLSAEIPFSWDVFNSFTSKFTFTDSGTPNIITIPTGSPTGTALAASLQSLMAAIRVGFTVTFNTTTLKFTFTQPAAVAWSLTFGDISTPHAGLGFLANSTTSATGAGSTIISPLVAMVTGPSFLYLNSNSLGNLINFNTVSTTLVGMGSSICRIPVTENYGNVVFYNDPCNIFLTSS